VALKYFTAIKSTFLIYSKSICFIGISGFNLQDIEIINFGSYSFNIRGIFLYNYIAFHIIASTK